MLLPVVEFSGRPKVHSYAAIFERTKIADENQETKHPSRLIFTYDPKTKA